MTDLPMEDMDQTQQAREAEIDESLREDQEAKGSGDGEAEREREGALPE
jgi:hypothetical protein